MKLVRYLKDVKLLKSSNVKQANGTYVKSYNDVGSYRVQLQRLNDEVSASIYGENITKMYKITSSLKDLENYLIPLVSNTADNISLYFIEYKNNKYKIMSATEEGINIELI